MKCQAGKLIMKKYILQYISQANTFSRSRLVFEFINRIVKVLRDCQKLIYCAAMTCKAQIHPCSKKTIKHISESHCCTVWHAHSWQIHDSLFRNDLKHLQASEEKSFTIKCRKSKITLNQMNKKYTPDKTYKGDRHRRSVKI